MERDTAVVREYYDANAELEWQRLDEHPFEFLLTSYMMERYIQPGERILDIGGGPGTVCDPFRAARLRRHTR